MTGNEDLSTIFKHPLASVDITPVGTYLLRKLGDRDFFVSLVRSDFEPTIRHRVHYNTYNVR